MQWSDPTKQLFSLLAREFTLFTCKRSSTQKMDQKKNKKFRSLMVSGERRHGHEGSADMTMRGAQTWP